MTEEDFINELTLDTYTIYKDMWHDVLEDEGFVTYGIGCTNATYLDPITTRVYICNSIWRADKPFIAINDLNPSRVIVRKGDMVVAIITRSMHVKHPFRINIVPLESVTGV